MKIKLLILLLSAGINVTTLAAPSSNSKHIIHNSNASARDANASKQQPQTNDVKEPTLSSENENTEQVGDLSQDANAQTVPTVSVAEPYPLDERSIILERMLQQNKGGVIQNDPAILAKNNYLIFSGRLDADAGGSSRTPSFPLNDAGRFSDGESQDASLTNAFLYADTKVLDFISGHVAGRYSENHGVYQRFDQDNRFAVPPFDNPHISTDHFSLDEGYIRLNNFDYFPGYLEAGRFYLPFGNYELHPLTETLPQQLSQTQADAVELGLVEPIRETNAVDGVVYFFHAVNQPINPQSETENNFGGQIAYQRATQSYAYKIDVGALANMNDVGLVATTPFSGIGVIDRQKRVVGLAVDAVGNAGPFDGHVNYVSALTRFNPESVAFQDRGAKPKAIDVGAGYSFKTFSRDSRIGLSYQHSWQASGLGLGAIIPGAGLPEHRAQVDYIINVYRYINVQAQVRYDKDYGVAEGGTHRDAITGLVRLSLAVL